MKRILILLLLVTACQQGPQPLDPHVGTTGIVMQFGQNAPPVVVLENYPFPVRLMVVNAGASHVDYDRFLFTFSTDPLYIGNGLIELEPEDGNIGAITKTLHGRSLEWPRGESQIFSVPASQAFVAERVIGTREKPNTQMIASVCYAYHTLLTTEVCVDANVYADNLRAQVCHQEDLVISGGQGAPVEITEIEVESYPIVDTLLAEEAIRPSFILHIRNAGDGRVVGTDDLQLSTACLLKDIPTEKVGAVEVKATLLEAQLECTPNPVRLFAGEGETRCTVPVNDLTNPTYRVKQNFKSILIVNLSYLYSSSISLDMGTERAEVPEAGGIITTQIPGYVYEGGQQVFVDGAEWGDDPIPLTYCKKYASAPGSAPPGTYVMEGWSCACDKTECLRRAHSEKLGCEIKFGVCPEPTYCCGSVPDEEEDEEE